MVICLSGSCIHQSSTEFTGTEERSLESTVSKNNPSRIRVILCQPAICCSSRSPSWAKYGGERTILLWHRGWGARRCCRYVFHSSSWETSMPVYSKVQRRSPQVSQPRLVQFQLEDVVPDYSKVQRRSPPSVTAETRPVPLGRRRCQTTASAEGCYQPSTCT